MYNVKDSRDAIGTVATPATLTAAYAGNAKELFATHLENLHLDIQYIPKTAQTDRYIYIKIEGSNDDGTTYFPLSTKSEGSDEIKLYCLDGATASDANIIPLIVPGEKKTTGGVTYKAIFDCDIIADFVKISVQETGSADFGTVYVRSTLSNKK